MSHDELEAAMERTARRVAALRAENAMLLNAVQDAQRAVVEGRYDDCNKALTRAINEVLKLDSDQC